MPIVDIPSLTDYKILMLFIIIRPYIPVCFFGQGFTTIYSSLTIYCQALCQHADNLSTFNLQCGFNIFHNIVPASPPALPKREGAEVQRTLLLH